MPKLVPISARLRDEACAAQRIVAALGAANSDAQTGAILQSLEYTYRLGRRTERKALKTGKDCPGCGAPVNR